MRSLCSAVVTALLGALACVVLTPAHASAANAPNVLAFRTTVDATGQYATPPGLLNHVFSGTKVWYKGGSTTSAYFVGTHGDPSSSDDLGRWTFTVPRNLHAGTTYAVGGSSPTTIDLYDANIIYCYSPTGSLAVHSATWSTTGVPLSLSLSFAGHCSGQSSSQWVYADLRYQTADALGALEADDPTASTPASAQVGSTPAQVVVPYTNYGSAAVTPGATSIVTQTDADHPAWSIADDGCAGVTVATGASCDVTVAFAPQLADSSTAVLSTPDGWRAPALRSLRGTGTSEPDQPEAVALTTEIKTLTVAWRDPSVTSEGGKTVDGYQVVEMADGVAGAVVGTDSPTGYFYHNHSITVPRVIDGASYDLAVREHFTDGSVGPLSVDRTATVPRRVLYYSNYYLYVQSPADGTNTLAESPTGVQRIAVSPMGKMFAFEYVTTINGAWAGMLDVAPASSRDTRVGIQDSGSASGPTWTSPHTVVYGHSGDDGTYLAAYDTGTKAITPVPGGTGLVHPAAVPDGTLVAEPAAGGDLVHLAGGVVTDIPNTSGCTWPAVSVTGRIACVVPTTGDHSTVKFVGLDGSGATIVSSLPAGTARTPNWSMDGQRLYVSMLENVPSAGNAQIFRVDPSTAVATLADNLDNSSVIAPAELDAPNVQVASTDGSAAVTWPSLPATAGISSSVVRLSTSDLEVTDPAQGTAPDSSSASSATFNGLTAGTAYTLTVLYLDADGAVQTTASRRFVAGAAPAVSIASGPGDGSVAGPVTAPFVMRTDDDADAVHCTVDGADVSCPGGVLPVSSVPGGSHVIAVAAVNAAGEGPAVSRTITVDRTAPTVTVPAVPAFSLGTSVTVKYSASDATAGVLNYDVRERLATPTTLFGAYLSPSGFSGRTATSLTVTRLAAGTTVCLSVRGHDKVGNVSGWSPERCGSIAADDSSMTAATTGWTRLKSTAFYRGTDSRASRAGATLTTGKLQHGLLAVVVTTSPGDGKISVYDGNTRLKTIALATSSTHFRVVIPVGTATRGYALRIVSLGTARVDIDGWALLRQ